MKSFRLLSFIAGLSMIAHLGAEDLTALPENGWGNNSSTTTKREQSSNRNRSTPKDQPKKNKPINLFLLEAGPVYLKPYQGGTDFAQLVNASDINVNNSVPYGTNKALDFDYDWGVRGGIGYQIGKSLQTVKANYLYLSSSADKTTTSDYDGDIKTANQAVFTTVLESGGGGGFGSFLYSAHSKWNLHFNMLDLTFGKKYPKKRCMSFEPFIGLKGMLVTENQTSSYTLTKGDLPGKLKQKIHFKGAGIMGGLNLDWTLTHWLSFIGSIDAAFLYSSVETKRSSNNEIPSLIWIGSSHDIKGTPVLDGMFALRSVYCWKSGRFIDLKIGFEEHYVFETMKHVLLNADSTTDLSLMGWFATLGFGF